MLWCFSVVNGNVWPADDFEEDTGTDTDYYHRNTRAVQVESDHAGASQSETKYTNYTSNNNTANNTDYNTANGNTK